MHVTVNDPAGTSTTVSRAWKYGRCAPSCLAGTPSGHQPPPASSTTDHRDHAELRTRSDAAGRTSTAPAISSPPTRSTSPSTSTVTTAAPPAVDRHRGPGHVQLGVDERVHDDVQGHRAPGAREPGHPDPRGDGAAGVDVEHHEPRRGRVPGDPPDRRRPVPAGRRERVGEVAETGEAREPEELRQLVVPPAPALLIAQTPVVGERLDRRRGQVEDLVIVRSTSAAADHRTVNPASTGSATPVT